MEGSGKMVVTAVGIYSQTGIILSLLGAAQDEAKELQPRKFYLAANLVGSTWYKKDCCISCIKLSVGLFFWRDTKQYTCMVSWSPTLLQSCAGYKGQSNPTSTVFQKNFSFDFWSQLLQIKTVFKIPSVLVLRFLRKFSKYFCSWDLLIHSWRTRLILTAGDSSLQCSCLELAGKHIADCSNICQTFKLKAYLFSCLN